MAREHDILKLPVPKEPPWRTSRRIGIHTSIAGGVENAAERAWRLGCSALQIFSSSPRQWKPTAISPAQASAMKRLRQQYDLTPLVIHSNYLINMAAVTPEFYAQSIRSFRGEVERGMAVGAEYLVLHPGSFRGASRADGLARTAIAIEEATEGLDLRAGGLTILIENTAGAEYSLGASFDQVAALLEVLKAHVPVQACIDTCHTHVSGHDIISDKGYEATLAELECTIGLRNVPVWHCNDAKAACGSRLDRHQHIGKGTIGMEPFRRLLNDPRLAHAAFLAETPIDEPGDDVRNVEALKSLVEDKKATPRRTRRAHRS
jgi:deoxyribonuclease-4